MTIPKSKWTFDEKCEDLAEHFLAKEPHSDRTLFELSQAIQDAIDFWFAGRLIDVPPGTPVVDPFQDQMS